jgi:hypothetical protein
MLASSRMTSETGASSTRATASVVRWVSGSKRRAASSTSPKRSSRTGSSAPGGKMSMSPPRIAKSPGSVTVGAWAKPIRAR